MSLQKSPIKDYELRAVISIEDDNIESYLICQLREIKAKPLFYSVYEINELGESSCVADVYKEDLAYSIFEMIRKSDITIPKVCQIP